jgi:pimeloyl-ACP methyl ester carboxylesterase
MRGLLRAIAVLVLLLLAVPVALWATTPLRETRAHEPVPAEGRLVDTAMGRIYVEEAGPADGPPVLLVHGSVGWAGLWRETAAALAAQGWRAIAFDMPPMGWSDRDPTATYDRATQGRRVAALARALDIRPVLVAHSFGAGAASEAAMAAPEAFSGLVIVAGALAVGQGSDAVLPLPLRPHVVREVLSAATVTNPWISGPLVRMYLFRKDRADPYLPLLSQPYALQGASSAVADLVPSLLTTPRVPSTDPAAWAALDLPLALIWGAEDTATPLAQGEALAELTGAPLTVLPGIGHIPQMEDPAAFAAALLAALEAVRARD